MKEFNINEEDLKDIVSLMMMDVVKAGIRGEVPNREKMVAQIIDFLTIKAEDAKASEAKT